MPGNWISEGERTYILEAMLFKQVILGRLDWLFICYAQICFRYSLFWPSTTKITLMDDSSRQKGMLALKEGNLPVQENSGIDLESKGKQEALR
jgi:hypothetical protein